MRSIKDWQAEVHQWIEVYGVRYFDEKTNALLLAEEVGELCKLIARKYGEQSFKSKDDIGKAHEKIADEIGDVFFVLTCLANQMDFDLEEILKNNIKKKTDRDNIRHLSNDKLK